MELHELRQCVELALELIDQRPTIVAAEVYASWEEQQIAPLQYHTAHPEAAVPRPYTQTHCGLSMLLQVVTTEGTKIGWHSDDVELSYDSICSILEGAIGSAVPGTLDFLLPSPGPQATSPTTLYDATLLLLPEDEVGHLAHEALHGTLQACQEAGYSRDVRLSGDVRSGKTHVVVGNTQGLLAHDTATGLVASVQVWLPADDCWGSCSRSTASSSDFSPGEVGTAAAQQALQMRHARRIAAGDYPVILGPQAVAALLYDLWVPACSLDTVARHLSPLHKRSGQLLVSPLLSLIDDPRLPGLPGSRSITDEGVPTAPTTLIERGQLQHFLADAYHAHYHPVQGMTMAPRNGFRCAIDGRRFAMRPGIFPTNLMLLGHDTVPLEELLAPMTTGIYVGNLWATTATNGPASSAFRSTVIGPSFAIEHGKLTHPIPPGTLQLHDDFVELWQRCTGVSRDSQVVLLPTQQAVVVSPELRCHLAHVVDQAP